MIFSAVLPYSPVLFLHVLLVKIRFFQVFFNVFNINSFFSEVHFFQKRIQRKALRDTSVKVVLPVRALKALSRSIQT